MKIKNSSTPQSASLADKTQSLFVDIVLDSVQQAVDRNMERVLRTSARPEPRSIASLTAQEKNQIMQRFLNIIAGEVINGLDRVKEWALSNRPHFHDALTYLIKARKTSVGELAEVTGIDVLSLNHLLMNIADPSQYAVYALAKALGVDPIWMLTGEGKALFNFEEARPGMPGLPSEPLPAGIQVA